MKGDRNYACEAIWNLNLEEKNKIKIIVGNHLHGIGKKMMYTEIYQNQCSVDVGIKNWETSYFAVNNDATEPRVEVITSTALRLSQWLGLPIWNICVANDHGYVQPVENTFRFFRHSWFVTGFVTRLTWRVPLVRQELLILLEYLSSLPVFSGVHVSRSLVLCVLFCR